MSDIAIDPPKNKGGRPKKILPEVEVTTASAPARFIFESISS